MTVPINRIILTYWHTQTLIRISQTWLRCFCLHSNATLYLGHTKVFLIKQITPSLQRVPNTTLKSQTRVNFVKNNASNCPTSKFLTRNKSVFEFVQPDFKTRSAMSLIGKLCSPFTFNISFPQLILIIKKRNTEEFLPRIPGCNPVQLINTTSKCRSGKMIMKGTVLGTAEYEYT